MLQKQLFILARGEWPRASDMLVEKSFVDRNGLSFEKLLVLKKGVTQSRITSHIPYVKEFIVQSQHPTLVNYHYVTDFRGSLSGHSFTGLKITTSGGGIELQDHCPY